MHINILAYIENTAPRLPDKPAFVGENGAVTFGELHRQARGLGSALCRAGLYKEPVVVFMEKSAAMIAAFLGVVYAGCYYVPLDAETPAFRLRRILETVGPRLILCDETTRAALTAMGLDGDARLFSDLAAEAVDENALAAVRRRAIDLDPVYVVFTSGSTGTPKGVIASHRSVIDYIENLSDVMGFTEDTVFGNQVPLYVDACLKEVFPTLRCGATTYLIPKSLFMFPVRLVEYINANGINTVCWVVSAFTLVSGFGALEKAVPHTLHTVAFGSEVFPLKQFRKWRAALPQARFVHLYGPTEATGMSAYYEVPQGYALDETMPETAIPIGRPFRNTEILLLTEDGRPPAPGQPGEICLRGAGLCLGYYRDEEKTRAAFTQNPLSPFPDLLYKTGDLGRYNAAGELVFIARRDHQIKHMGHRIELGEIEWAASELDGVSMTCAVFDAEKSRIILYYTGPGVTAKMLAAYCKETLPRYMLPYAFLPLETLPLTPNGKADRVGLLAAYKNTPQDQPQRKE